jgi:hypothetical protein
VVGVKSSEQLLHSGLAELGILHHFSELFINGIPIVRKIPTSSTLASPTPGNISLSRSKCSIYKFPDINVAIAILVNSVD